MNSIIVSFMSMLLMGAGQQVAGPLVNELVAAGVEATHVKPSEDNPKPIRVTIRKTDGSVVSGATVNLYDSNGNLLQSGTSSSTGEYTFEPVNPGTYRVTATKSGYTQDEKWVIVTNADVSEGLVINPL